MIRGAALALAVGAASPAIAGNAILFAAEDATFVVTSNDVAEAVAIENDGTHVVYVTLDLALTDGLASFTKTQIGNPVAVSVCGRELMRPVVQAVIETPAFVFQTRSEASAASLVSVLKGEAECGDLVWDDQTP